jgi:hypothetical protein
MKSEFWYLENGNPNPNRILGSVSVLFDQKYEKSGIICCAMQKNLHVHALFGPAFEAENYVNHLLFCFGQRSFFDLILVLIGNPGYGHDLFAFGRIKYFDAPGTTRAERNAVNRAADGLTG